MRSSSIKRSSVLFHVLQQTINGFSTMKRLIVAVGPELNVIPKAAFVIAAAVERLL